MRTFKTSKKWEDQKESKTKSRPNTAGSIYWLKSGCKGGKQLFERKSTWIVFPKFVVKDPDLTWMLRKEEWSIIKHYLKKKHKSPGPVISEPLQFIFNGDHFASCDIFALYYHFVNDGSPSLSPFYNISPFWKNLAHFCILS